MSPRGRIFMLDGITMYFTMGYDVVQIFQLLAISLSIIITMTAFDIHSKKDILFCLLKLARLFAVFTGLFALD